MLTKRTMLALFCSLVFPICPLLYGQATGSFFGTVSDKTGSVVTGAQVTVGEVFAEPPTSHLLSTIAGSDSRLRTL